MADEPASAKGQIHDITVQTADGERIKPRCPICSARRWGVPQAPNAENFQPVAMAMSKGGLLALPMYHFICGNCGFSWYLGKADNQTYRVIIDE